jgi:hypothetical protein
MTMFGLAVRWSLADAGPDVAQALRDFVRDRSLDRFTGMEGLRFKTWRMVADEWFEGTYVWETAQARDAFAETDRAGMTDSPGTRIIGSPPVLYETFEVVGVAEGAAGFAAGPGPQAALARSTPAS